MTRALIAALSLCCLNHSANALVKSDLAKCAGISEPAVRLACYDDLTKNPDTHQAVATGGAQGAWQLEKGRSEIDGSSSLYLSVEANSLSFDQQNHPTRPSLWIRCAEGQMSLYVWWKLYLGVNETSVSYRVDAAPARTESWIIADNNEFAGLWTGDSAIPLIKKLLRAEELLVHVTPYDQTPTGSTFEVGGLRQAIKPLRASCDW